MHRAVCPELPTATAATQEPLASLLRLVFVLQDPGPLVQEAFSDPWGWHASWPHGSQPPDPRCGP